ncbi:MAG: hypothetical protein IJA78_03305, partial [Clostridia bacterium]|nr:hypothetical protein [Clostridia bacterium]
AIISQSKGLVKAFFKVFSTFFKTLFLTRFACAALLFYHLLYPLVKGKIRIFLKFFSACFYICARTHNIYRKILQKRRTSHKIGDFRKKKNFFKKQCAGDPAHCLEGLMRHFKARSV